MNKSVTYDVILRSTVRLARLSFSAAAASVFLVDRDRDELVFEASSGEGEDRLIGMAIPADSGIAGWVVASGETLIVRSVDQNQRFNRSFAEQTGYVPEVLLAAPLEHDGEIIGVLEVLDPKLDEFGDIAAMDLLSELANQSCAALSLLVADRSRCREDTIDVDLARLLDRVAAQRSITVTDLVSAVVRLVSAQA